MRLTAERLRELFLYDPETGVFTRRASLRKVGCKKKGTLSGGGGYTYFTVDYFKYYAHRLAWLYVYGEWPTEVDHIDGNRSNNAISNLRDVTRSRNILNQRRVRSDNRSTGLTGVSKAIGGFTATIYIDKRRRYLGTFKTSFEAALAYRQAKNRALRNG
jgi:hypothetical protein